MTGLNILGIKLLAGMNFVFVAAQFVFIVVFAVMAIGEITGDVEVQSFTAPFFDSGTDLGLVFAGAAILALSFLGLRRRVDAVRGDRQPAPQDPDARSCCARSSAAASTSSSPTSATSRSRTTASSPTARTSASADVMTAIGGDFLNCFFTAAYVAGCFACAMASQASVSRILFAMGRDGSLPKPVFARLHPRYRTPVIGEPRRRRCSASPRCSSASRPSRR